jgi:aldehyde dehydrogenase (NAD+)
MSTTSISEYGKLIQSQRDYFNTNVTKDIKFRKQILKQLLEAIRTNEDLLNEAIYTDFKKSKFEVFETELGIIYSEIKLAIDHLDNWAQRESVPTNLANLPASSYIISEPLGVTLVIGAWNYPYLLSLHPLISAISAGNTVILKPSEIAPESSAIMAKIINENFETKLTHVLEGGIPESTELLKHKFDKIFYTGSTAVGKIIYRAAAEHLTPVTLELGGKSPGLILEDAKIKITAQRLVWGKFINAGQTCVAPDYLLVDAKIKDKLITEIKTQITKIHGENPENSEALSRIINKNHFERLIKLIDMEKTVIGGETNDSDNYIAPTVMDNVNFEDAIMQDEIFGPILPIISYTDLDWAIQQVKERPKPLALYVFTESIKAKNKILNEISFGGGAINETLVHLGNHNLPFGGVGSSGTGSYHGKFGFDCFSHKKAIHDKPTWFEPGLKYPPYTDFKLNILKKIF